MAQCNAKTHNGTQCKNKPYSSRAKYCKIHSPSKKGKSTVFAKGKVGFEAFKKAWTAEFGKAKSEWEKRFINGKIEDFRYIWAYYYDYCQTPENISVKDYLFTQKVE